jgi:hypothetical protein
MYEMQGPHVTGQHADLPIPRPINVLPGPPPCSQSLSGARSPGSRTTLGVAPAADFVLVVKEFLLPLLTSAQGPSLIFSRIFRRPQNVHCYPLMTVLIHRISTAICTSWGWRVPNRVTRSSGPTTDRARAYVPATGRRARTRPITPR